jgi:hypothetical protein
MIKDIIENDNLTESQKEDELIKLYVNNLFKGGYEMKMQTYEWFDKEYPNRFSSFKVLIKCQGL